MGTFYSGPADALRDLAAAIDHRLLPFFGSLALATGVLRRHQSLIDCLNCGLRVTYLLTDGHLGCFYLCVFGRGEGVHVWRPEDKLGCHGSHMVWVGSRGPLTALVLTK